MHGIPPTSIGRDAETVGQLGPRSPSPADREVRRRIGARARAFPDAGAVEDNGFSVTSLATLVAMVAEGLETTLPPQLVIDAGAARGQGQTLMPLAGAWPREVILAWRKASARAVEVEALGQVLRAERPRLAADKG